MFLLTFSEFHSNLEDVKQKENQTKMYTFWSGFLYTLTHARRYPIHGYHFKQALLPWEDLISTIRHMADSSLRRLLHCAPAAGA